MTLKALPEVKKPLKTKSIFQGNDPPTLPSPPKKMSNKQRHFKISNLPCQEEAQFCTSTCYSLLPVSRYALLVWLIHSHCLSLKSG